MLIRVANFLERLLLALALASLASPLLFAQELPEAEFRVEIEATDFTEAKGTPDDPLDGSKSIKAIGRVVDDPNPTPGFYHFAGWGVSVQSGSFCQPCTGFTCRLIGAEGSEPTFNHAGVQSDTMVLRFVVTVEKPDFQPAQGETTVYLRGGPGVCDGSDDPVGDAPFDVALSTGATEVPLGSIVNLVGSARDTSEDQLTFQFFDSTIQGVRGTLVGQRVASNCTSSGGCSASLSVNAGVIPRTRYYKIEVSDGSNVKSSSQRAVSVVSEVTQEPEEDEDEVCTFGDVQVTVNAGPAKKTVVGPADVPLEGSARTTEGAIPGVFQWTIVDDAGLGSQLSLASSNSLNTSLSVPDVDIDRTVRVNFSATFNSNTCTDNIDIEILAEPPPEADLELASLIPSAGTVTPGSSVSYEAVARNNGPADASGVTLVFNIPPNSFESAPGCSLASGSVSDVVCDIGTLASGATVTRTVTVRAGGAGSFAVTSSVFGADGDSVSNNTRSETTQVNQISTDLSISKVANTQATSVGGAIAYTITVTNNGPEAATGVTVTDTLANALTFVGATATQGQCEAAGATVSCDIGDLAVDASAGITIEVTANLAGTVVNTATVGADQADTNGANDSSQAEVDITDAEADLEIFMEASPNPVGQDKNVEFTMSVRNNGPDDANSVVVEDVLPKELAFVSAAAEKGPCTNNAGSVNCALGTLVADEITFLTLIAQATGEGAVTNTATVRAGAADPDEDNNEFSVEVRVLSPNFLAIPHTVAEDTFIGLALVNRVGGPNAVTVEGRDSVGTVMSETPLDGEIAALGQQALLTSSLPTSDTLIIRGLDGPLQSFFMIGDFPLQMLDGIGSAAQDEDLLFLPRARQTEGDFTKIYLFNPDLEVVADVTARLLSPQGDVLGESSFSLNPQGSLLADIEELFGVLLEEGYVRLESSQPIRGFEMLKVGPNIATIQAQRSIVTPALAAPHFFIGTDQQTTRLRLVNANPEEALVTVRAIDDDGGLVGEAEFELAPNGLAVHDLDVLLGIDTSGLDKFEVIQGFLEIELQGGTAGPFVQEASVVPIISYVGQMENTLSSLSIPMAGEPETLFLQVAQEAPSIFTGLAILNNNDDPAEVTVEAFDSNGDRSALRTLILDPRSRIVGLLNNSPFFGGRFEQTGGYLQITSDQDVISFALFGGSNFLSAIGGQKPLR